ncbi:MAG: BolA family transcriptional regulator [Alphaproteobacteria bacterium]
MQMEQKIQSKLVDAFAPQRVSVSDFSEKHAEHQDRHGRDEAKETHFAVTIVADSFVGRSRVERHRMVYEALAQEMAGGIHALAITALTPDEEKANAKEAV